MVLKLVVGNDVVLRKSQSLVHKDLISLCGCMMTEFSLRIGVAGEYCKVTGGLLWKANKALLGNKQNLKIKIININRQILGLEFSMVFIIIYDTTANTI